ncbi:hypothetical protein [Mycobacterium simiae]|uniref:hypothetical protein n=1 Tax=Mycobacterium simiae TaxID=1784 RepID=UPI002F965E01
MNAALHLRASRDSYDAWAGLGAEGWDYESLLPYLDRCEGADDGHRTGRATDARRLSARRTIVR